MIYIGLRRIKGCDCQLYQTGANQLTIKIGPITRVYNDGADNAACDRAWAAAAELLK